MTRIFIIASIFWASGLNAPIKFFEHHKFASTYYVSTPGNGGSDANPGTIGSPFATLGKAESVVVAGDLVNVNVGTYSITSLSMSHNGTLGNVIEFRAVGAVTVNVSSAIGFDVSGAYRLINGFTIVASGATTASVFCTGGNDQVTNSTFTGTFTRAVWFKTSANNLAQNLTITQNATTGYGIMVGEDANTGGSAASNNTLDNVRVTGTNTGTIHGIIFGGGGSGNVLKNSYVTGTYYGLVDKVETNTLCFNNIFNFTQANLFVCMYDKGSTGSSYYNNICRNTGSGYGFLIGPGDGNTPQPSGAVVKNNIFIKGSDFIIYNATGNTSVWAGDYNCYQYTSGTIIFNQGATNYSTLATWQATGQDAHSIASTPLFTDASGTLTQKADFKPATSSPVINTGVAMAGRSTDAIGNSLVSTPDMGALEFQSGATVYYISTAGNDGNSGTSLASPWRNIEKIASIAFVPGDIVYIRAGVYNSTATVASQRCINIVGRNGNSSAHILISAYPPDFTSGGRVTYNCTNVAHSGNAMGITIENCSYIDFTGIWVKGPGQTFDGSKGSVVISWWDISSPNCTYNNCEASLSETGFRLDSGNDVTYNNCDAHDEDDPFTVDVNGSTGAHQGSDGFSRTDNSNTATRTIYNYCRSYRNSDDGWDCYGTNGIITYNGCWSFQNGYYFNGSSYQVGGDGNGYKMAGSPTNVTGSVTRFMNNCLAAGNIAHGYDQNSGTFLAQFYNCDAIDNGHNDWKYGYNQPLAHQFRNNVSFRNAIIDGTSTDATNWSPHDHNTWNGSVTVTAADFASLDLTQLYGARKTDGSLPDVTYGHLLSGSDLINAGIDVGVAYNGTAPDMGAFEFNDGTAGGGGEIGGGGGTGGTTDADTKTLKTGRVAN